MPTRNPTPALQASLRPAYLPLRPIREYSNRGSGHQGENRAGHQSGNRGQHRGGQHQQQRQWWQWGQRNPYGQQFRNTDSAGDN